MDPFMLVASGGIAGAALGHARTVFGWGMRRTTVTATLFGDVYQAVSWRLQQDTKDTCLTYGNAHLESVGVPEPSIGDDRKALTPRLGLGTRYVTIEGRRVLLSVSRESVTNGFIESLSLCAARKHKAWLQEYLEDSVKLFAESLMKGLPVYAARGTWWELATIRPYRHITTIEHPSGAPQTILDTIQCWKSREDEYIDRGENFQLGFLLSGPPGTGKTSTAIAIASELKRPLYVILPGPHVGADLQALISSVPESAIVLFEECDELFKLRKDDDKDRSSVASALSLLDGPLSKHGIIRFYTTNHPERIDPSFMREGRCDHHFSFDVRYAADRSLAK